ncbi:MAG TPA: M14 family metallopeptidase [Caulobacteraceae bacterium]|nr:M14 family metallopeptidase [Caulobacteraceae bacterium]
MRHTLAVLLALALGSPAMAQTTPSQPRPWEGDILPPAPVWKGKSERLMARANDPWITPSETTGLTATPSYAETMAFVAKMDAASDLIRVETFGRSPQGRDLVAVLVSKDGAAFDPNKPVMLFQGGIHSGEIDGKDAGLMLLRDIAFKGRDDLLDRVNLIFVPIFNVDGHERTGPYSRPNQRGPVSQGWRTTAQNLNLNRDYAKVDSPEMRAMIGLIRKYDPDLYLDLHVTDGVDYAYDITFGFAAYEGRYARSPEIGKWLEGAYTQRLNRGLKAAGHIPGPLIFAVDDRNMAAGLGATASPPRFSTGYGDAVGMATVLVENHSLKPYRQRVLGTYVLLEESIRALAEHGAELQAATDADRARRSATIMGSWRFPTAPGGEREHLPIAYELYDSPASGRQEVRWLGKAGKPIKLPVFYSQPGVELSRPDAYWVPATKPEVIERLRVHGIRMEAIDQPRTVSVEMLRLKDVKPAAQASEGHVQMTGSVAGRTRRNEVYPAGSVRVPTDQPLGQLAMLLLEPESDESLFGWGFFPEITQRTEYIEGYAIAPMAERMLAADSALKAEFEAKLAADPEFARNPDARLSWFYERTPFFDDRWLLYPVGREINLP